MTFLTVLHEWEKIRYVSLCPLFMKYGQLSPILGKVRYYLRVLFLLYSLFP